jgi:hypothetical protein
LPSSFDAVPQQVFCRWVLLRSLGSLTGATKIDLKNFQREIEIYSSSLIVLPKRSFSLFPDFPAFP